MATAHDPDAKHPRSVFAGPYGHPIHPALVTLPIGAWVSSLILDIAVLAGANASLAPASRWLIGIGVLSGLLAAVFGGLDLSTIPRGSRAHKTGITHMMLNTVALVLFAVSFWLRIGTDAVPTTALILSIIAVALIGASGWLGGKLAYRYGVRVADEQTQAEGFR